MKPIECPVCLRPDARERWPANDCTDNLYVQCGSCGEFGIIFDAGASLLCFDQSNDKKDKLIRPKLARWLYETRDSNEPRLVMYHSTPGGTHKGLILDFDSAKERYEDDGLYPEKCQKTLSAMGSHGKMTPGQEYVFPDDRWLVKTVDEGEAERIVADLVKKDLLAGSGTLSSGRFTLTLTGWGYVNDEPPAEDEDRKIGFDKG